jgi:nicotinate-nucleotide adenylyltransferase
VTSIEQPRRIGVLGGTFDPVHNGHLYIANALRAALDLERVVWVPAGRPPHKAGQIVSRDRDRLAMLDLALAGSATDVISTIDIDRSGPSYTADTLEVLAERFTPARLFFLMGEDSLRDLPTWHDPERLLRVAELAVAARPGVNADLASVAGQVPAVQGRVHPVPTEEIAISSSEIRKRVRENQSIHGLVPAPVEAYIRDHGLYSQLAH